MRACQKKRTEKEPNENEKRLKWKKTEMKKELM